ncbi:MAG: TraR/DksA family transcriptional regulator [Desulfuromonadales bacterium]|jgi:DnaK suppressor protein
MNEQTSAEYCPSEKDPYMCDSHMEYFRQKLLLWRKQLEAESQGTLERLREEKVREADIVDQGQAETDLVLNLKQRERCRNMMARIDAALVRIDDGTYGFCEETGEEIGLRRLMASPLSTLSVEAQERFERMLKLRRFH